MKGNAALKLRKTSQAVDLLLAHWKHSGPLKNLSFFTNKLDDLLLFLHNRCVHGIVVKYNKKIS